MVIEVSKEIDVVRIGIDRYSLKTGLKLRSVMDVSIQVIKEPRGFIRIIQCLMAILAFSTTAGFSTECKFSINCGGDEDDIDVEYEFGYPFSHTELEIPHDCDDKELLHMILPFNYSNASGFFVATGVISFMYTIIILTVYIFFHQTYSNNPKLPVVDLVISVVLSIFWMAGSSAWAQGVTDLKYYLHPETLFQFLFICLNEKNGHDVCDSEEDGSYGTLNASLILGFANFLLWTCSLWFIYKETVFHSPEESAPPQNQSAVKGVGKV
ncbi:synaptophysin [Caerostris extrusa]|uniref:Synaptophysin n=1 Tax=Caerostris extrusa TaxID=172846 RepID=A0AAV4V3A3_CAEEX|nr:synaptophysin [Caerostris extrusa]